MIMYYNDFISQMLKNELTNTVVDVWASSLKHHKVDKAMDYETIITH